MLEWLKSVKPELEKCSTTTKQVEALENQLKTSQSSP
jgi:hypothetical protein